MAKFNIAANAADADLRGSEAVLQSLAWCIWYLQKLRFDAVGGIRYTFLLSPLEIRHLGHLASETGNDYFNDFQIS
jgi:hypothetical protein